MIHPTTTGTSTPPTPTTISLALTRVAGVHWRKASDVNMARFGFVTTSEGSTRAGSLFAAITEDNKYKLIT